MKTLIIIPTYNEVDNIPSLIKAILALALGVDILVVDDNSPDGTGNQVLALQENCPALHLLARSQKDGLGQAYLAGFAWAKEHDYEAVIQMDADWSHSPT
jgi:dolichol-phosphate mannosyltransferase